MRTLLLFFLILAGPSQAAALEGTAPVVTSQQIETPAVSDDAIPESVRVAPARYPLDLSNLPPDLRSRLEQRHANWIHAPAGFVELEPLLRDLIQQEQYDAAEIRLMATPDGPTYHLALGRIQKILSLEFTGIESLSEYEVRREFGITDRASFDQQLLLEASERVRAYYEGQGFAQTKIDLEFQRAKGQGVSVKVTIQEGPRTVIREMEFLTQNPELAKQLKRELRRFRGDPINDKTMSEIRAAIRSFLSRERYYRTDAADPLIERIEGGSGARLVFQMKSGDRYRVEIEGNEKISTSSLRTNLNLTDFTTSNPNVAAELGSKVKAHYIQMGYARAEILSREEVSTTAFEKIVRITVNEGPRIHVRRIDWIGRFSRDAKFYTQFVTDRSSEAMKSGYFVRGDLDSALKDLVTDRWNQGFLKARVVSIRTSYNANRDEISIQVNFDEGPLTQIQSIQFVGLSQISEKEARSVLLFHEGEALRLNDLEESVHRLRRHYQEAGFLEMAITNEKQDLVRYSQDNAIVDVVFQIYEGPKVVVDRIVIEGNTITQDNVILKELDFVPGDTLSPSLMEESTSRLQRLGHFSSVEIHTLEEKTPISRRTVVVRVIDRDPGLFNLGFGVNNDRGLTVRGYTGLAYRNLWGTGRGISARVDGNYNVSDIKYPERKITLGYLEPYLFDTRIRGRVNLTQAVTVSDYSRKSAAEVKQSTYTLEQDLTSHILLSWDVWSLATVRDFLIANDQDTSVLNIGNTAVTMDFDYRDHPFNPTKGFFSRLNLEYGAPWLSSTDTIEYVRGIASTSHYQPIGGRWVWANAFRLGYLKNLSNHTNAAGQPDGAVPYDKKGLILGGQTTLRGFTLDEAFPNHYDFGSDYDAISDRYNLKTQAQMFLIKSELRFPIWGSIGGAFFYDGGSVTVQGVNIDPSYRHTAGIAARYATPVGAVSIEYGIKLNPQGNRGESSGNFHFYVGTF